MSDDAKKREGQAASFQLERRSFLQMLGAAFTIAALPEAMSACGFATESTGTNEEELTADWKVDITRPEDLLVLTFGMVNLQRDSTNDLVKRDPALDAPLRFALR